MPDLPLVILAQENRPEAMVGLRLLFAGLARHCPHLPAFAYVPPALHETMDASLRALHPRATTVAYTNDHGWGCKPTVMLDALKRAQAGDTRVLWVDADIMAIDTLDRLAAVPPGTLIIAEESNPHGNARVEERQAALDLEPGPPRVTTLSSCVVGATAAHRSMLEAWECGVRTELFASMQGLPWGERLLPGDQEVLEAVVCSEPFRAVPLHVLRNFNEMMQATYTPAPPPDGERPRQRPPLFVHATGDLKPWSPRGTRITKEMFPYFHHAQAYLERMEPEERPAFVPRSLPARVWKAALGPDGGFRSYLALRRLHRRLQRKR